MTLYKVIHKGEVFDENVSLYLAQISSTEAILRMEDGHFHDPALIVNQETNETEFEVYVTFEFRKPKSDGKGNDQGTDARAPTGVG